MTNKGRTTQSLIRESSSKFWEDRPEGTERDPGAGGAAAAAMRMLGFGMVLWTVPLKRCGANAIDPLKDSTFQNYFSHEIDVGRKRVTILGTLWGIKIYP